MTPPLAHIVHQTRSRVRLRVAEKRPRMVRNIRNIFNRSKLTDQEVRTLRGIVVALAEKKWRKDSGR